MAVHQGVDGLQDGRVIITERCPVQQLTSVSIADLAIHFEHEEPFFCLCTKRCKTPNQPRWEKMAGEVSGQCRPVGCNQGHNFFHGNLAVFGGDEPFVRDVGGE